MSPIQSHFFSGFVPLITVLHAHVWIVSDSNVLLPEKCVISLPFLFHDKKNCWSPADDKDDFCSFCALKEHIDESIRRSGSVIRPVRFRDNLRSILCSRFFLAV